MEDTDWRPSPCPICGKMREAARVPFCKTPGCTSVKAALVEAQERGRKIAMERRIAKPTPVDFYELYNWDGADGRTNHSSGFIVGRKELAEEWAETGTGRSYRRMHGILVGRLEDIPEAQDALKRQKALDKLTEEEKKLLGLA